jgi:hypothetical protein
METTKAAEAPESATETEPETDAKAVEAEDANKIEKANAKDIENENSQDEDDIELDEVLEHDWEPAAPASGGVLAATAAVVGAALGLSSLTGTWIADLMSERQNIIAQAAGTATTTNQQIAQLYGTPWHTTALFNGFFAIAAILVAVAVLLAAKGSATWVRALAWGGLALGVIGLFISGVIWFDVFTDIPTVAATTTTSSTG